MLFFSLQTELKDSAELVPATLTQIFPLLEERQQLGISTPIPSFTTLSHCWGVSYLI